MPGHAMCHAMTRCRDGLAAKFCNGQGRALAIGGNRGSAAGRLGALPAGASGALVPRVAAGSTTPAAVPAPAAGVSAPASGWSAFQSGP